MQIKESGDGTIRAKPTKSCSSLKEIPRLPYTWYLLALLFSHFSTLLRTGEATVDHPVRANPDNSN